MKTPLRQRLTGVLALLLLVGIIVGLPVVLLATGANPLSLPSLDQMTGVLRRRDDGTLLLNVIKVIGWGIWLYLTAPILLELGARVRGVRAPRLPGLRLSQSAARGLLTAAAMVFVALPSTASSATAAATPAVTATAPATTTEATATEIAPADARTEGPIQSAQDPAPVTDVAPPETIEHTVKPGESLWVLAEKYLGEGSRYREILDLNRDTIGEKPSFLRPGWVLSIPAPTPTPTSTEGQTYVVESGDTLSGIAQEHLGDPDRYPEIFEASRGITQPGGQQLTDPDEIDVDWKLNIPGAEVAVPAPAPAPAPVPSPAPEPPIAAPQPPAVPPTTATPTPTSSASSSPTHTSSPSEATTAPAHPEADADAGTHADDQLDEGAQWPVRTEYGIGALLAAGVLALIASRRRTQQRRRRPGQRLPLPEGRTADVENELRATADALSVEAVDIALRTLARDCASAGDPLPVVRAARLTADQFDLYLAEPATLPTPWTGTADATVWTLELENTPALEDVDVTGIPAPYPALVTIGHDDEDGHVFLDLEHLGALGVAGDPTRTREILAALAIELATSTWADDLQVTLVGAYPELEDALQTGRIRYLPSVGRILDELDARGQHDRQALAAEGAADLQHARVTGAVPDAWSPEIVLIAGTITARQRTQLEALVEELPRVALAAITSGVSVGEWALDLDAGEGEDTAILSPIGLQIRPQRLPAEQYGHLLEMAALTDVGELSDAPTGTPEPEPEPTLADIASVTPVAESSPDPALDSEDVSQEQSPVAPPDISVIDPPQGDDASATGNPAPTDLAPDDAVETTSTSTDLADAPATAGQQEAAVQPLPLPAPKILVMGPVDMLYATGAVEPSKRARLLEYAAYLALHPGASHTAIDDAIWPNRKTEDNLNTRNPATSKLRRWVGTNPEGAEYLPRHQAGAGYAFLPEVRTDVDLWDELLTDGPLHAPSESLEEALRLVRGRPFEGHHRRYYAWSEHIAQRLISEIVDASYELARRRLMEGRWRAAEEAVVIGLRIEPAQERLWRMRILAAHESRNAAAEAEAIERLLTITEELECELEDETEQLLDQLRDPSVSRRERLAGTPL